MSVPKSRRKESKLEVLYHATTLRDDIYALVFRSFGIYSRNTPLRRRYDAMVTNDKNKEYVDKVIEQYKDSVLSFAADMDNCLRSAKSIYPKTETDRNLRRKYQDKAIVACFSIKGELHSIVRMFDVDINLFKTVEQGLTKEIKLIKQWRAKDSRRYAKES